MLSPLLYPSSHARFHRSPPTSEELSAQARRLPHAQPHAVWVWQITRRTPKDGPSAGIGMVTSIISAITEIPVNKNVAMTGEITLRGLVLPIGGLKEKLLAAHRAGIKKVLIPKENKKDLSEVPKTVLDAIEIIPVKNVEEVLKVALIKPLKRVEWVDIDNIKKTKDGSEVTSRH